MPILRLQEPFESGPILQRNEGITQGKSNWLVGLNVGRTGRKPLSRLCGEAILTHPVCKCPCRWRVRAHIVLEGSQGGVEFSSLGVPQNGELLEAVGESRIGTRK